jgi:hypothetical protein
MRPMACATSSAGATASVNRVTLAPARRTCHAPTSAPAAMPPQTPRPPFQMASGTHQACLGVMSNGVVMSK